VAASELDGFDAALSSAVEVAFSSGDLGEREQHLCVSASIAKCVKDRACAAKPFRGVINAL